jgi:Nif-specific regulatory protein
VIHLYATNPENALNRDDLDFTIAVASQLAVALNRLRERDQLATGLQRVRLANDQLQQELRGEHELLGDSAAMVTLREQVQLFAATDATVLIRGESGCGKELIARSLHHQSQRAESPFICVNCAALNENLLESELFGHEKGAFTGASERRAGRFEQADGGTLFLDEVGEMSAAVQAKFLRILEGHPFERIGGHTPIHADVRIVAATNRDLEAAVEDGSFRRDLYFRLQVAELHALPLRDRPDDVVLLATVFLNRFVRRIGRAVTGFTDEALRRLQDYSWPGNVRELQNTIERTVILCRSEVVREEDLLLSDLGTRHMPAEAVSTGCTTEFTERSLADIEREQILATLEHTDWNKSRAAQILGIERSTLDRKLKRYHVQRPPS